MKCPACHITSLTIWADRSVQVSIDVNDDSEEETVDEEDGDLYWDNTSACLCNNCHFLGTVDDFEEAKENTRHA